MMKHYCLVVLHCLVVCCWFFRSLGVLSNSTTDTLEFGQEMKDWECLVSSNGQFELGFFNSPSGSTNRYLGILATKIYGDGNKTVVWVANRANPLTDDTSGVLKITQEGKLMINDSRGISFPLKSQQNFTMSSNTIIISARLDDAGNFVLRSSSGDNNNNIVWQSFDHPSHVWLQGMKLGLFNLKSGNPQHRFLTSWSSQQDPDPDPGGAFSLGVDPNNTKQQLIAWERSRGVVYWSSGMWNGYNFSSLLPKDYSYYYFPFSFSYISNENESYFTYYVFGGGTNNALIRLDSSGVLYYLSDNSHFNQVVAVKCDDPNNPGNTISPGCVKPNNASNSIGGNVFTETRKSTVRNNTFSEKVNNSRKKPLWPTIVGSYVSILIFISSCVWCYRRCRHQWFKGGNNKDGIVQGMQQLMDELNNSATTIDELSNAGKLKFRGQKDRELPFVSFSTIEIATGYFSETNKIGQGGYGPVYKGVLVNGQEIAVKRLSSKSRQGLKEFKNEVILISRLQHCNLVRLLGCCIQRDERILIYEYLSNKSLDFFLFDVTKQYLLDWKMRVSIIGGIAQGLLYLHKYSRLRIIHRDLKSSNILLDNDMNPKISDFGTARIFGDNENQANTDRIVGTYGYMSPEYAMDGLFSVKSDVFSFGVMMLEIISGKKNTGFYRPDRALNLLGYAWDLWKEEKGLELVDQALVENCSISEAMRYIQVGFLCVQEIAADRPNMLDVVSMLSNATLVLPAPKQPAFSKIMGMANACAPTTLENFSINDVTISEVEVR